MQDPTISPTSEPTHQPTNVSLNVWHLLFNIRLFQKLTTTCDVPIKCITKDPTISPSRQPTAGPTGQPTDVSFNNFGSPAWIRISAAKCYLPEPSWGSQMLSHLFTFHSQYNTGSNTWPNSLSYFYCKSSSQHCCIGSIISLTLYSWHEHHDSAEYHSLLKVQHINQLAM